MAIIPVPRILPRIVKIGTPRRGNPEVYIFINDIIERYVKRLFPGYRVRSAVPFASPATATCILMRKKSRTCSASLKRN